MGVEVSHAEGIATGIEQLVECMCEIRRTEEVRGYVNAVDVDRDVIDDGCDGEVFRHWRR